ncbi:hypothetical protein M1295_00575 [Patescibacteria group bacterium]|nr:hypothetical protein [Patescibacteria group bacterium]
MAAVSGGVGWYFNKGGDKKKYRLFVILAAAIMVISTIDTLFVEAFNSKIAALQVLVTGALILAVVNFKDQKKEVNSMEIRVMGVPEGSDPPEVREAWLGCKIPVLSFEEAKEYRRAVLNGDYVVKTEEAIKALETIGRSDAAAYIRSHALGPRLLFLKEICRIAA